MFWLRNKKISFSLRSYYKSLLYQFAGDIEFTVYKTLKAYKTLIQFKGTKVNLTYPQNKQN